MDELRLGVVPADCGVGAFAVEIFVNDEEMTSAGAGLGMDPDDLRFPVNQLLPRATPHEVAVARCTCGVYGCGSTDVLVTADGAAVHWDWLIERPVAWRMTFDREQYEAELWRFELDHSWETPDRTVRRLVRPHVVSPVQQRRRFEFSFAGNAVRDPEEFCVVFRVDDYQVFSWFRWEGRSADELARVIGEELARPLAEWDGEWWGITGEARNRAPDFAPPSWSQHKLTRL